MLKPMTLTLLTAFLLAGCGKDVIEVNPPPPPAEYLTCEALPEPPTTARLEAFEASNGALVYRKADVDARDAQIAEYVVNVRGAWFSCSNQLGRVRDYVEFNQ